MNVKRNQEEDKIYNILLVDDERDVLTVLKTVLERADRFDCNVYTSENADEAFEELEKRVFDLVLADHKMPGMKGVELLTKIKDMYPSTVRILITGYSDLKIARDAINKAEVHHYLEKPWENEEIVNTVYRELKRMEERESSRITKVEDVVEAMEALKDFKRSFSSISPSHPGIISIQRDSTGGRQKLIFEFSTSSEFNKFSFELKHNYELRELHKARIEDVQVFNNKYIVTVSIKP
ncbi:MAG: response regulator [Thermoplasmatota archaeon]